MEEVNKSVEVYNIKEKTIWQISDESILKRLRADPMHYEVRDKKPDMGAANQDQVKGIDKPVKPGK